MSRHPAAVALPLDETLVVRGVITHLFPSRDFGLLRTEDGRELPFQRESVDGVFESLNLGTAVSFREALTDRGPEAIGVVPAR